MLDKFNMKEWRSTHSHVCIAHSNDLDGWMMTIKVKMMMMMIIIMVMVIIFKKPMMV